MVFFDLDGTLVDSLPGITSAYHHVRSELRLGGTDEADLRPLIGPPIQVGLQQHFGLTGPQLQRGVRIFREHYATYGVFRFSKYPGVERMLSELQNQGIGMSIATSKLRTMAVALVDHAGWTGLFEIVGGSEPDGTRHHKRDVISWTMTQVPIGARVVAMVGDRGDDMAASFELGLRGVGVTWGYGSTNELEDAGATLIVDSPAQLLAMLCDLD
jgi:phosphoglycolate phosphatase